MARSHFAKRQRSLPHYSRLHGKSTSRTCDRTYNIKAAVWELYQASDAFNDNPEDVNSMDCESLLDEDYNRFYEAANNAAPKITIKNFFPKPYWTRELTASRKNR